VVSFCVLSVAMPKPPPKMKPVSEFTSGQTVWDMEKTLFGQRTGWYVNKLAIGTWQIGGPWGSQDEEAHERALFCYIGGGGNMIDTSDAYGDGYSESFIGKVLADRRMKDPPVPPFLGSDNPIERMFVFTKIGRKGDEPHDATRYTLDAMREAIQGSRKRLGLEELDLPIDLVQLQCPPTEVLREGSVFTALEQLKSENLIEHWGVVVDTVEQGMICLEQPSCVSISIVFNAIRQKPMEEFLPAAMSKGVAVIARSPLAGGFLTGKITEEYKFEKRDHRSFNLEGEVFDKGDTVSGIGPILRTKGAIFIDGYRELVPRHCSVPQTSLRWVLDHPEVTCVIPGSRAPRMVLSNDKACLMEPLPEDTHERIKRLYDEHIKDEVHHLW